MFYLVKTPSWLKMLSPNRVWEMGNTSKTIYLTFDDGPHPEITRFVLDQLKTFNAKATFFCIGKNVSQFPGMYRKIIDEGHTVGNHSYDHLNGWETEDDIYLENIAKAKELIDSQIFRPPYGRLTGFQERQLRQGARFQLKTIMWTVLSGDFDPAITPERCLENVLFHSGEGSIIVFHDSEKAWKKLEYSLPKVLHYFTEKGFSFASIPSIA